MRVAEYEKICATTTAGKVIYDPCTNSYVVLQIKDPGYGKGLMEVQILPCMFADEFGSYVSRALSGGLVSSGMGRMGIDENYCDRLIKKFEEGEVFEGRLVHYTYYGEYIESSDWEVFKVSEDNINSDHIADRCWRFKIERD